MTTASVEKILARAIGLDGRSLGAGAVTAAARARMAARGLTSEAGYAEALRRDPDELQALVESVVVPETWFFRDTGPYRLLKRYAKEEWPTVSYGRRLRVLSAPCSSGEEPYSIAITLLEAGLDPNLFSIRACDISSSLLHRAKSAHYGRGSFRGSRRMALESYISETKDGFAVRPAVRNCVRFSQGNLLERDFLLDEVPFDVVFCRNLLIYVQEEARERILQNLDRLVRPGGLLFVGHAEMISARSPHFRSADDPAAFALRKEGRKTAFHAEGAARSKPIALAPGASTPRGPVGAEVAGRRQEPPRPGPTLEQARRLADAGRLDEAARMCERLLESGVPTAAAFELLGVVREAAGLYREAEECFNKALYLDPACHEAVLHLAAVKIRRGDTKGAEVLRSRAARLVEERGHRA